MTVTATRYLEFVFLPSFERTAEGLFSDDDVRALEQALIHDPRAGDVVPGTGGVRKVRVAVEGRGKRGGSRVVYLYVEVRSRIYLLLAYAKNEQADLSPEQARRVRQLVEHLKREG
ncbi:MAG TPA: type II toxin-antitoxin system RelE/ParE family toxin [Longimicrobium sp.]|nr:type II toxin-antitoxin system RelE/ParE family toxin [Longimicrobium sp.]